MNTTEKEEKTTNRKVEDKVSNTPDNFQPQKIDGFSKSKLEHICTIWRKSAQKKSDKKFKVIFFKNSMYSVATAKLFKKLVQLVTCCLFSIKAENRVAVAESPDLYCFFWSWLCVGCKNIPSFH